MFTDDNCLKKKNILFGTNVWRANAFLVSVSLERHMSFAVTVTRLSLCHHRMKIKRNKKKQIFFLLFFCISEPTMYEFISNSK